MKKWAKRREKLSRDFKKMRIGDKEVINRWEG